MPNSKKMLTRLYRKEKPDKPKLNKAQSMWGFEGERLRSCLIIQSKCIWESPESFLSQMFFGTSWSGKHPY